MFAKTSAEKIDFIYMSNVQHAFTPYGQSDGVPASRQLPSP